MGVLLLVEEAGAGAMSDNSGSVAGRTGMHLPGIWGLGSAAGRAGEVACMETAFARLVGFVDVVDCIVLICVGLWWLLPGVQSLWQGRK